MKSLAKNLGWALLAISLIAFNGLWFLGKYRLSDDAKKEIENDYPAAKNLWSEKVEFQFPSQLISFVNSSADRYNLELNQKYNYSEEEINSLIDSWSLDKGFKVSLGRLPIEDTLKSASFMEAGSWLDGREYNSREDLEKDLNLVQENIKKYGPVSKEGFDRYKKKSLRYAVLSQALSSPQKDMPWLWLLITFGFASIGGILIFHFSKSQEPGINHNGIFFNSISMVGWTAMILGAYLILFYIGLYFFPEYMVPFVSLTDPLSLLIKGKPADPFFMYGLIYTIVILVMGYRMFMKYRHSNYQKIRTASVMFFQLAFAFLIPEILVGLNKPYFDFKNIWPLDYDFFFDYNLSALIASGGLGIFMLFWGLILIVITVPVMTYFFGKRFYCSWVCGCGGLAETAGDPFRQLSNKSVKAWKIERYLIHGVLVFAVFMTGLVLYTYFTGESELMGINSYKIREVYGAWIGAGFAGVVGTGFYPLMGNRVWCRFGCPLAAYIGMVQRFKSRFRITTNGGQCISCGNCSTYCEMGIDVRWYAQRGQNIVRSSCVGCGVCSAVCPRGVLNLENLDEKGRLNGPNWIGQDPMVNETPLLELPRINSGRQPQ